MLVDAIDHVGGPGLGGPGTVSQSLARAVRLDPHRANEAAQLEVTSVVARSALATNTALAMQPQACVQLERSRCLTPLAMSATAQIRQLRSPDGVYFTKPGARKLAHYVEREITRLLAARTAPVPLPTEPPTPDANAVPGQPVPRPLAGPIVPLVAASISTDQLLGGPGSRPAAVDALAARTLVKGEPLAAPAGRADDFAWPRREIGREQAKGESPVVSTTPDGTAPAPAAPAAPPKPKKQFRPAQTVQPSQPGLRDFFGGFGTPPRQIAPPPSRAPGPAAPGAPRPPGNVGRAAEAPAGNITR